jgi:hypothetical protein
MHQRAAQRQPLAQAHGQGGSQIVFVTMQAGHVQNPLQAHVAGLAVQAVNTGIQADVFHHAQIQIQENACDI